jgi:hypothetical protein
MTPTEAATEPAASPKAERPATMIDVDAVLTALKESIIAHVQRDIENKLDAFMTEVKKDCRKDRIHAMKHMRVVEEYLEAFNKLIARAATAQNEALTRRLNENSLIYAELEKRREACERLRQTIEKLPHAQLCAAVGGYGYCSCGRDKALAGRGAADE